MLVSGQTFVRELFIGCRRGGGKDKKTEGLGKHKSMHNSSEEINFVVIT